MIVFTDADSVESAECPGYDGGSAGTKLNIIEGQVVTISAGGIVGDAENDGGYRGTSGEKESEGLPGGLGIDINIARAVLVQYRAGGRFYAKSEVGLDEGSIVNHIEGPGREFVGSVGAEVGDGLQEEISGVVGGVNHQEGTAAGMVVSDVVPLAAAIGLKGGDVVLSVVRT